jgi:glycerophosphoryl diester phosphodiesterase
MSEARPLVIAHRGACWGAPENTLEAFELAVEEGADYIEFDVRQARDGRLVICHDPPPDPCPPDIPTLDATLEALRGRVGLAVEIKEEAAAEPTATSLAKHGADPHALIVLSFKLAALDTVFRRFPDVRAVVNLGHKPLSSAKPFWGVSYNNASARPRALARAQKLGLATFVYTVNEPARMRRLAELGVTGIFSDRPALLRETMAALPGPGRGPSPQETSR